MKKIILLLFLFCFSVSRVWAVYFYYGDSLVPNMYMVRNSGSAAESSAVYLVKRVDTKEYAYCIEPLTFLNRDSNYIEYNYNNPGFNLSDEIIKKINLIAYYGYEYPTHDDIAWYGVTQYLIWKTIYPTYAFYFADARFGNMVNTYDSMVLELMNLVDKDLKGLDLKDSYDLKTGKEYILLENDLLNNYEIENANNLDIKIIDNKLVVKSLKSGDYSIKLKHKNWRFNHYFLYDSADAQDLFISGHIDTEYSINLSFEDTKLTIYKVDSDYPKYGNFKTDGAIYNLYDSANKLVASSEVRDSKMEFILPLGIYYLEEVKPSLGFKLNLEKEKINLDKEMEYTTYEDRDYKHVKIHKQYNIKKELYDEEGAIFDLYLDDTKIEELTTNDKGIIEIDLPYGNYKLIQVGGIDGYNFSTDYKFIIDSNYKDDTIELINYKKEVLGDKTIIIKYEDVPNTYLDDTNTYYSLYKLILILMDIFEKIYL